MINDDKAYNEQINHIAVTTFLSTLDNGMDPNRILSLHEDIMALQETVELTADTFGKTLQQVEEDVIDALEYLPVEDLGESHRLKQEGMLN